MCSYCGCQSITVIGALTAEHEAIVNAAGQLRRAAEHGDARAVGTAVQDLADLLHPHTHREERGLFRELRQDDEFAAEVGGLCDEHDVIDGLLDGVAHGALDAVPELVHRLRRHIDREENGLFPAAAVALDGPAWERVVAATDVVAQRR